jgi:hypothetical protein
MRSPFDFELGTQADVSVEMASSAAELDVRV